MSNYAYKRRGGPLVKWTGVAPSQSRAADAVALGDCQCKDAQKVPKPGAPEFIGGLGNYVTVGADDTSVITKIDDAMHSSAGRTASMAASIYHGYKRNQSVGWALAWGLLGYIAPVVTPVVAAAQGFGHKKGG